MKSIPFCLSAALVLAGCSGSEASGQAATATIKGAVEASTFPGTPSGVTALDEGGKTLRASLDAHSAFTLRLPKGHTYRLVVNGAGFKSLPVVFHRASGQLDTTFHISGGGVLVELGSVRYSAAASSSDTGDDVGKVSCDSGDDNGADGECENGVDQNGAPCTDPAESADPGDPKGTSDGECENGVDQTGAPCIDPPDDAEGETVDPNEPMAVTDHNVPDDVGGCDSEKED